MFGYKTNKQCGNNSRQADDRLILDSIIDLFIDSFCILPFHRSVVCGKQCDTSSISATLFLPLVSVCVCC